MKCRMCGAEVDEREMVQLTTGEYACVRCADSLVYPAYAAEDSPQDPTLKGDLE